MIRKITRYLFLTVGLSAITACQPASSPLEPPELSEDPYFKGYVMTLKWTNIHNGIEGFEGYNVYISTNEKILDLSGQDTMLAKYLVRARIGKDSDSVVVNCTEMTDGTYLFDLDSFYVHIRSVAFDTIGEGDTQYLVIPKECQVVQPPTNLAYEVIAGQDGNPGGGLSLTWNLPQSKLVPSRYRVSGGGDDQIVTTNACDWFLPSSEVRVSAIYGEDESESAIIETWAMWTISFELWPADTANPSLVCAIAFDTTGIANTYSLDDQGNWSRIDYYMNQGPALSSPRNYKPSPLNNKNSLISGEKGTDIHDLGIAPPTQAANYSSSQLLLTGYVYALWVDYKNDGYSPDDRFGKICVTGVDDNQLTLDAVFQKIPGLRWIAEW